MSNKLPLVDLKRQYQNIKPDIQKAINEILDNTDFIMGNAVNELETGFAQFCNARHAIGVGSGTAAIQLILHALELEPNDEIITVPNTFFATVEPIFYYKAKPVFVDVNADDSTLDPEKLEAAITPRTRAIMPVHLYGQCANMNAILDIANRHNLPVIEDSAQAQGAMHQGKTAGSIGWAAAFSFYPGKNIGAYGDAGAITTNDDQLAERLRRLRNHGRSAKYEHLEIGYGERIDTLQAAILNVKLAKLQEWNELRRQRAAHYTELLDGVGDLSLPQTQPGNQHIFHQYVIRTKRRDALAEHLKQQNISSGIHYPIPLHLQPALKFMNHKSGDFPITETLAKEILSLPMFPEMTVEEVQRVSDSIRSFFK